MAIERPVTTQSGYSFRTFRNTSEISDGTAATNDFRPPSLLQIKAPIKPGKGKLGGGAMILALYATPTKPGYCRHIGCQVRRGSMLAT